MSGTGPVNERIARRRAEVRAQRRRRRLRRTIGVTVLLAVLVGGAALERSSLVALATVEVVGLERLDEDAVLLAAQVRPGTSVLRLRLGAIEDRVVGMPLVDAADVSRDGALGLRIEVDEAAPALTAVYDRVRLLVSDEGQVLGAGEAPGTPIVLVPGFPPEPGRDISGLPTLATAHAVVLGLPGPVAALVERTHALGPDSVELELEGGIRVRWGGAERGDEKARALGIVLEDLDGRAVTVIDVRAPMAPTVTP